VTTYLAAQPEAWRRRVASAAAGRQRPESDLDLALLSPTIACRMRLQRLSYAPQLEQRAGPRWSNLIVLNRAPRYSLFRRQKGQLIFCRDHAPISATNRPPDQRIRGFQAHPTPDRRGCLNGGSMIDRDVVLPRSRRSSAA